MKRNSFLLAAAVAIGSATWTAQVRGEDGVTPLAPRPQSNPAAAYASRREAEENYNLLKAQLDELTDANRVAQQKMQEMSREIEELRAQLSKPQGNYASAEDLKQVAAAVEDLNKKREADKQLTMREMEKLARAVSDSAKTPVVVRPPHRSDPPPTNTGTEENYSYTVKKDDTLKKIAQKYRDSGIMVSSKDISAANPNVNWDRLLIGTKLIIPQPKGGAK